MPTTVKHALTQAISTLSPTGADTPRLDAEVLLAHLLRQNRAWLVAHNDFSLSLEIEAQYKRSIQRRAQHEPVAYIIGQREFYGLTFHVSPQTLIPRPETELLVEEALRLIQPNWRVLDVGTGSGCIAITLALHAPQITVFASDISAGALAVARQNARQHRAAKRIKFFQADLLKGLNGPFNLIVSNPPYISMEEWASLAPGVKDYEPSLALNDGASGLKIIEKILQDAPAKLASEGALLIEIGAGQGSAALKLAQKYCPLHRFEIKQDLARRDRLLIGRF